MLFVIITRNRHQIFYFKYYLYKWAVSQRSMRKNIYQPKTTKREMFLDAIYEADEQADFTEEKVTIIVSYVSLCSINNIYI